MRAKRGSVGPVQTSDYVANRCECGRGAGRTLHTVRVDAFADAQQYEELAPKARDLCAKQTQLESDQSKYGDETKMTSYILGFCRGH